MLKLKAITIVLIVSLIATFLPVSGVVYASEGDYTYTVSGGVATITGYPGLGGDVVIPSSLGGYPVTHIGSFSFAYKSNISSIVIPDSVTSIGKSAFYGCSSLTEIIVDADNPNYKSIDGVLFIKDGTQLIQCPSGKTGEYTIPDGVTSIGGNAFYVCSSLTSIVIPSSVINIGDAAFYGCSSLASIVIPSSVTNIGRSAFQECSSLTSIVIPYGVTSIGDQAFYGCSSITSIVIPDSVTNIGRSAFTGCSSLTIITIPDSVTSLGVRAFEQCTGLTSVIIGNGVTNIGERAFGGCSSLISVTIGNSVIDIGNYAFQHCTMLASVIFGNSVRSIGISAFEYCSRLTGIVFPSSLNSISFNAFNRCSSLKSITISESVTSIGSGAFSNCSSLENINVVDENQHYSSINGILYNKLKTILIQCPTEKSGSINIPESVTSIGDGAFVWCEKLTNISIPNSVTSIGSFAFAWCTGLTSVVIPDSLEIINGGAFHNSGITSIIIPSSVTSIGNEAFDYCSRLQEAIFMGSPPELGSNVFRRVPSSNIIYYISVNQGWESTFGGRPTQAFDPMNRYTITYHDTGSTQGTPPIDNNQYFVSTIVDVKENIGNLQRDYAGFIGWSFYQGSETVLFYPGDNLQIGIRNIDLYPVWDNIFEYTIQDFKVTITGYNRLEEHIQIPEIFMGMDVIGISKNAFEGKDFIKSIQIPKTVNTIPEGTFYNLSSLEEIIVDIDSINYTSENGVLFNKDKTTLIKYPENREGAKYIIPSTVTRLGSQSFSIAKNLKLITIPDNVTSLGNEILKDSRSLEKLVIGDGITVIPTSAFQNLPLLNEVILGDKVTEIGLSAFQNAVSLSEIEIPSNVNLISWYAFDGCNILESAIFYGDAPEVFGKYVFRNTATNFKIYHSENAQGWTNPWNGYQTSIAPFLMGTVSINGSLKFGEELTADIAAITPSGSVLSYQWHRNGEAISGATSSTYTVTQEDIGQSITITVTGTGDYIGEITSELITPTKADGPEAPVTAIVFEKSWDKVILEEADGYEYKMDDGAWQTSGAFENLDSNKDYTFYQRIADTSTHFAGEMSEGMVVTTDRIVITGLVTINGIYKFGEELTADITGITPSESTISYQWNRNGEAINGAINTKYIVTQADLAQNLTVTVTGTTDYIGEITSELVTPTKEDGPEAPVTAIVFEKSWDKVILQESTGYEYKMDDGAWQISGTFENLNPNKDYTFYQRIAEIATHFAGEVSEGLVVKTNRRDIEGTVTITGILKFGEELTADITGITPSESTIFYQWNRNGEAISGATSSTYTVTQEDIGQSITITVTGTGDYIGEITSELVTPTKTEGTEAPSAPIIASKTSVSVIIQMQEGYEYKIGDGEWKVSGEFTGLSPNTTYTFYSRIAETATHEASLSSDGLEVTTDNYLIGDMNNDGRITTVDALMALQAASGRIALSDQQKLAADVNKDGRVSTVDALMILQYASGRIAGFE